VLRQEIKVRDDLLQKAEAEFGDKAVNNARFERNLVSLYLGFMLIPL